MISCQPSPKIERALKDLQDRLIGLCHQLESVAPEERRYLNKCALISNVGASTRIENAVLTDVEIEWVDTTLSQDGKTTSFESKKEFILDKLSKERERSIEEVVGCRDVLATIYLQAKELQPLTETVIRGLHHELLRHYPPASHYAGQYKTVTNRVIATQHDTGEQRIVLEPSAPGVITETAMRDLVEWYNGAQLEYHWPLLVAVEFTFRFLAIHPFQDGNGRLGRALFLLALLQSNDKCLTDVARFIAIDRHIEQHKTQYYAALHQCSDGKFQPDPARYRYEPLFLFYLKMAQLALADIDIYRKHYADLRRLPETALRVLECFKSNPQKRLKVGEIEVATGLPRRSIQYALNTLSKGNFLQRLGMGAGSRYQLLF
ncbi:MAG: hypothetical protein A2Z01_02105 [Betaproteobacteria bacterium RBG_16_58_11]|nr:MAG: hypothetical protein A2Z01_02105 [Betaproteobacteria bacterium RBG_16_58_11]